MKKSLLRRITGFMSAHKIVSGIVLIIIIYVGYRVYTSYTSTTGETRYVLQTVSRGVIIESVSGTGQVSAQNQLDIKPKVSGDIVSLPIVLGQEVSKGTILAVIDSSDAEKAVRDAKISLESAKLSLKKLMEPTDSLSIIQSENSLSRAKENSQNVETDLKKTYQDGIGSVTSTFLDLPTVMSGLRDILFSNSITGTLNGQWNIDYYTSAVSATNARVDQMKTDATAKYQLAKTAYDNSFVTYQSIGRFSSTTDMEAFIVETYETTRKASEAVKSANDLIQYYVDTIKYLNRVPVSVSTTHLSSLGSYANTLNSHLQTLYGTTQTIKSDKDAIVNAARTIAENTASLVKLKEGADALDIASSELSLEQRVNALMDVQDKLNDYYVRAPFDGTIASLGVKVGDSASSGTAIATLMTKKKIADISLNEVDVAKIKLGQRATILFDAVSDLTMTGEVVSIDAIGTVSQGVVSYNVEIGFDTQDERVKSGMSVSASIIIESKLDVLLVPNSAVKSDSVGTYVDVFDAVTVASMRATTSSTATSGTQGYPSLTAPQAQTVVVGLANDTSTEIVSGLKDGDSIVVKTITATTKTTAASAPSLLQSVGGNNTRRTTSAVVGH